MRFRHFVIAAMLAASCAANAQIMPWENRTDTDSDPFAESSAASSGALHLEDVKDMRLHFPILNGLLIVAIYTDKRTETASWQIITLISLKNMTLLKNMIPQQCI